MKKGVFLNINHYKIKMFRDKKNSELGEVANAMMLLRTNKSKNKNETKDIHAILEGKDWEYPVKAMAFTLSENNNLLFFHFNKSDNNWTLEIKKGYVYINRTGYASVTINLRENSLIDVGTFNFTFNSVCKAKKNQKSYQKLIYEAITSSKNEKMSLSEIYDYFTTHYGFSEEGSVTWKNSIRHNLSINKIFKKVQRERNEPFGKGMYWKIDKSKGLNFFQENNASKFSNFEDKKSNNSTKIQTDKNVIGPNEPIIHLTKKDLFKFIKNTTNLSNNGKINGEIISEKKLCQSDNQFGSRTFQKEESSIERLKRKLEYDNQSKKKKGGNISELIYMKRPYITKIDMDIDNSIDSSETYIENFRNGFTSDNEKEFEYDFSSPSFIETVTHCKKTRSTSIVSLPDDEMNEFIEGGKKNGGFSWIRSQKKSLQSKKSFY